MGTETLTANTQRYGDHSQAAAEVGEDFVGCVRGFVDSLEE